MSTIRRVKICHHHSMLWRRTVDWMQASYKSKFLLSCLITMESDLIYFWLWQRDPEGVAVAKEARPKKKWMQRLLTQQYALSSRKTQCWSVYQIREVVDSNCGLHLIVLRQFFHCSAFFVMSRIIICRYTLSVKCWLWPCNCIRARSILLFGNVWKWFSRRKGTSGMEMNKMSNTPCGEWIMSDW